MPEHSSLSPSPSGWKQLSEAQPSLEDCAQTYKTGEASWTGFLWVLFRGKVVQGLATRNAEGLEVMPSMPDGYRVRDEVTHWHRMYEPAPPASEDAAPVVNK